MFKIQKRAIRIIMGSSCRDCCRNLFKNLEIIPHKAQYIFSVRLFVVNNMDLFMTNSENHTTQSNNLHLPLVKLKLSINKEFTTQV